MDQQESTQAKQQRVQAAREDFDLVLEAIDTYLTANPANGPVRPRNGRKPLPGTSIPSAVAGAAQRATAALHECGYRIVNAYETYEALVLAGNDKRLYEHNELLRYRQAYTLTAEAALRDMATKTPTDPEEAYNLGYDEGYATGRQDGLTKSDRTFAEEVNAPLKQSTIDALNKLIAEDKLARRTVNRRHPLTGPDFSKEPS